MPSAMEGGRYEFSILFAPATIGVVEAKDDPGK